MIEKRTAVHICLDALCVNNVAQPNGADYWKLECDAIMQ